MQLGCATWGKLAEQPPPYQPAQPCVLSTLQPPTCEGVGVDGFQSLELVALLLAVISHGPPLPAMDRPLDHARASASRGGPRQRRKGKAKRNRLGHFAHAQCATLPPRFYHISLVAFLSSARRNPLLFCGLIVPITS